MLAAEGTRGWLEHVVGARGGHTLKWGHREKIL